MRSWSHSQEIVSAIATVVSHSGIFYLAFVNRLTNERADGRNDGRTNERTNAPRGFPFWDFCFVSCKSSDERTNGRTKRQTNERFALASPRVRPAVPRVAPCAVPREEGRLMIKLGSQQPKKHSSDCEVCLAACLRERRTHDDHFAFADAFEQRARRRTKEATPPSTYLIVSGSDDPDLDDATFRRAATVSSAPALIRFCPRRD